MNAPLKMDILTELECAGVGHLVELILSLLRPPDLCHALQVCSSWSAWDTPAMWTRRLRQLYSRQPQLKGLSGCGAEGGDKECCRALWRLEQCWSRGVARTATLEMESIVLCVALVEGGVLCGLNNGVVEEWREAEEGQWSRVREKEVHCKGVKCMARMRDGSCVTGSYDGHVKVWDQSWHLMADCAVGEEAVMSVVVEEESGMVAVGGGQGTVACFKMKWLLKETPVRVRMEMIWREGEGEMINCLVLAGNVLIVGNDEGIISRVGMTDGRELGNLGSKDGEAIHRGGITGLQVTGKNKEWLWSGSYDCSVKLWCLETSCCVAVLVGHTNPIRSLCVDGGRVVSGDYRGFLMIWEVGEVLEDVRRFNAKKKDDKWKTSEGLYCMRAGRLVRKESDILAYHQHVSFLEHRGHVTSISIGPGVVVSGSRDRTVNIHNFWTKGNEKKSKKLRKSYL